LDLAGQCVKVDLYVLSILVGVDAKITELAALAAERDVQIQPQRSAGLRRSLQGGHRLRQVLWLPRGERRIVGDEVIAQPRLLLQGLLFSCGMGHQVAPGWTLTKRHPGVGKWVSPKLFVF